MSQPIRSLDRHLRFPTGSKTHLVENIETLLPVKFRLIPLSGFREEMSKIEKVPRVFKIKSREKEIASSVKLVSSIGA